MGSHAKDAGGIVGGVGSDGRKVGHSFYKGLVDSYQSVIAAPTDSRVKCLARIPITLTPKWAGADGR
jgi:hypothetical protein